MQRPIEFIVNFVGKYKINIMTTKIYLNDKGSLVINSRAYSSAAPMVFEDFGDNKFGIFTDIRCTETLFTDEESVKVATQILDGNGTPYASTAELYGAIGDFFKPSGNEGRAHIGTGSLDTMVLTDSVADPSYITGFANTGANDGIELTDSATGTFQNTMGRTIVSAAGTISFHPTETGGGVGIMYLLSERSIDGITWTVNPLSLRRVEIPSNGESFATKVSSIANLLDGEYFRFRMYEAGSGGVTLTSETETVMGQSVVMPSATFILTEQ